MFSEVWANALSKLAETTWDDLYLQAVVPPTIYWLYSSLFYVIDKYNLLPQYQIFLPNARPNAVSGSEVIWNVLEQQFCQLAASLLTAPFEKPNQPSYPQFYLTLKSWAENEAMSSSSPLVIALPWIVALAWHGARILGAMLVMDFWYFWAHYSAHANHWIYKRLHAHHHQLYRPKAYGASFNTLAETFIFETVGAILGSRVVGLTPKETLFFFTFSTLKGCDDHSGYDIPWNPISAWGRIAGVDIVHHNVHHQAWGMKYNYALFFNFWETILGCGYVGPRKLRLEDEKRMAKHMPKRMAEEMVVYLPSEGGKPPAWGPPTATTNFCEEDYHVTSYAAEFINTISNVGYVYFGLCGLFCNWRRRPFLDFNLQYLALVGVGIGSAMFHMTLKRSLQSADQLSMFFGAAIVLHRVVAFENERMKWPLGLFLIVGLSLIFYVQYALSQPVIHWTTFALMLFVIWRRVSRLIKTTVKSASEKNLLAKLGNLGFVSFVSGYGFWLVDVYCCSHLRAMRHTIGVPLEFVLEFHGWWHVLTGIGVYLYMVLVEYLHLASSSDKESLQITWSSILQTPVVTISQGGDSQK
ncbi:aPHC-domain-containing protein [Rhizodiscina lignyota]|uniref:APHC-domain-containing protein n=1 Tax=Rhizodiscina lignyota TaxID=1504668 RepID=A0A9P4M8U2_9PEZI|nr:aPHC-domain-containing protein [Rhizodiscina lignyota]